MSDSINELATALSKAQKQIKNAVKDSDNPYFKSKYADLAAVWDACREALATNNLSIVQIPECVDGKVTVYTILLHSSGQWIDGELTMVPTKSDPQGIGSVITYARRYSLSGFVGVASEDDDGNAASGNRTDAKDKASRTTEPITFKKLERSAALDKEQGANQKGVPEAADASSSAPAVKTVELPAVEVPGSDCIDTNRAKNFHLAFKRALPEALRDQAEELCHEWLRKQGIVDVLGKPSALAIREVNFFETREEAIAHARSYGK